MRPVTSPSRCDFTHSVMMGTASLVFFVMMLVALLCCDAAHAQTPVFACDASNATLMAYGFCNRSWTVAARAADLKSRLTPEEKVGFLVDKQAAVLRLGIPEYAWGSGTPFSSLLRAATRFPQHILIAAIDEVVSNDTRAMNNVGRTPNIIIFCEPRWGRGQETPGEDPPLSTSPACSGLDLNFGNILVWYTVPAVHAGKLSESDVDRAITNNFITLIRLSFFDGDPRKLPFGNLSPKDDCTSANQELTRETERQGIVLLKNKGALPLSAKSIKTMAVIGPNANASFTGTPCKYTTPLQGLGANVATVYQPGCTNVGCSGSSLQLDAATKAAASADVTVLIVGADQSIERESLDRTSLLLPGQQPQLVSAVANASRGPCILIIMSGGPFDISFVKASDKISAILWVGYPGEAGGAAIADILFGYYN